jgi:hypothetical protein
VGEQQRLFEQRFHGLLCPQQLPGVSTGRAGGLL